MTQFEKVEKVATRFLTIWLMLATVLGLAGIPAFFVIDYKLGKEVKATEPAGKLLSLKVYDSSHTRVMAETNTGFYLLSENISLPKNQILTLQHRGNGDRHLCDQKSHCTKLL